MAKAGPGWAGAALVAFASAFTCTVPAATRSAPLRVTANVEASCHVHSPSRVPSIAHERAAVRVHVSCSQPVPFAVSLAQIATDVDPPRTEQRLLVFVMY